MKNKKTIMIILLLTLSIFIGITSSASLAYFNNVENKEINSLEIYYNK